LGTFKKDKPHGYSIDRTMDVFDLWLDL